MHAATRVQIPTSASRYLPQPDRTSPDFTRQDAAILNILRACEAAIDGANVLVRQHLPGIPQSSRDSFKLLADAHLIPEDLSARLQRMIGFRSIAVHQYRALELPVVEAVLHRDLDDC